MTKKNILLTEEQFEGVIKDLKDHVLTQHKLIKMVCENDDVTYGSKLMMDTALTVLDAIEGRIKREFYDENNGHMQIH